MFISLLNTYPAYNKNPHSSVLHLGCYIDFRFCCDKLKVTVLHRNKTSHVRIHACHKVPKLLLQKTDFPSQKVTRVAGKKKVKYHEIKPNAGGTCDG